MVSSTSVVLFALLIQSISCAHVEDNRIIIGSSVGGILGLVRTIVCFLLFVIHLKFILVRLFLFLM